MATQKHLTLEDRYAIQHALEKRHSFRTIARSLDKDPTTISKEVRRHRQSRYYVGQGRIPTAASIANTAPSLAFAPIRNAGRHPAVSAISATVSAPTLRKNFARASINPRMSATAAKRGIPVP